MAETKAAAGAAFDAFIESYELKYEKAAECLHKDRDALLAFYDFPAEHWKHLRTTDALDKRESAWLPAFAWPSSFFVRLELPVSSPPAHTLRPAARAGPVMTAHLCAREGLVLTGPSTTANLWRAGASV